MKKMPTDNRSGSPSPGGSDDDGEYWDSSDLEKNKIFNRILKEIIRKKRTPRIEICRIDNLHKGLDVSEPPKLRRRLDNDHQDHDQHQDCKRAIKIKLIKQNKNIVSKNHDHDQAKLQKKKIKKVVKMEGPEPPPGMPRWLREVVDDMGGEGERLLIQKRLSESDLSRNQNRISMPMRQIRGDEEFLSEEEMRNVAARKEEERRNNNNNNSNPIKGMDVTFVQPYWRTSVLSLRIWEYEKSSSYIFTGKVKEFVENNGLKVGDIVQIWFFRCRNRNPCFALVNLTAEMASSSSSAAFAAVPEENPPGATDDTEPSCS